MKVSDLTEPERKIWQAACTGTWVDLRAGDPKFDSPEKWTGWGPERAVRAEVIAGLLIGDGDATTTAVRGVRVRGARIVGDLDLKATTLRCPLSLLNCSFTSALNLEEAMAVSVCLSGSHVPLIRARQLQTRGDLRLDKGFNVSLGVELSGAHIGGTLDCTGGHFSNSKGSALTAAGLTVEGGMFCDEGFEANGEVRLPGAHIGSQLICTGGHFANPDGPALTADGLSVEGDMVCGEGFEASGEVRLPAAHIRGDLACSGGHFSNSKGSALTAAGLTVEGDMFCGEGFEDSGEVRLLGAHIGGQLICRGGHFSNPGGVALNADRLKVDQYMFCDGGFEASGEVILLDAHIGGQLICTGGHFSNPDGRALSADGLSVDRDMVCGEGFKASGEVRLLAAHIGGQLICTGGHFSNADGSALNLQRATVSGPLRIESTTPMLEGILDLTAAKTSSYHDNPASWPQPKFLRIDRFIYDAIVDTSVEERLNWLTRNKSGYSPQIYEQLAAVYHHDGRDGDARRILIEKQRRRFAEGNFASEGFFASKVWRFVSRVGGFLLHWTVGYGYRTWYALGWVAGLLVLGTLLFNYFYSTGDLTAASKSTPPPPFQPFLYTLDLLLPVASLHQRDGWVAQGAAQWCSVIFIVMGWILATAVVLSLTGLLKRD